MPSKLSANTLVDEVAEEIREMVLTGQVAPGEFLPTRKELATRFGVGLSTIQEAVQALSAVGLLASRPGKGTWVRDDALDVVIHPELVRARLGELNARTVYEARAVIEVALTEMAARRATPAEVERIWEALRRMEASTGKIDDFVAADLEFHLTVARASKNELLEQFYHLSRKLLVEVIREVVSLPHVEEHSIAHQRAIAEAIENGEPLLARRAARAHMAYVDELLTRWLA